MQYVWPLLYIFINVQFISSCGSYFKCNLLFVAVVMLYEHIQ
jgi:hypothetical protein